MSKTGEENKARCRAYYAANRERLLAYATSYREANREKFNASAKRSRDKNPYYQSEEFRRAKTEYHRQRRRTIHDHVRSREKKSYEKHKEKIQAANRERWRRGGPRVEAYRALTRAVMHGEIPRVTSLNCRCGAKARHYHHHNGYAPKHRLDVVPLCIFCHRAEHAVEKRTPKPSRTGSGSEEDPASSSPRRS